MHIVGAHCCAYVCVYLPDAVDVDELLLCSEEVCRPAPLLLKDVRALSDDVCLPDPLEEDDDWRL